MRLAPRSRRSAFTLLELLLASLIAILLLAGLYFALNITLRQTADARDAIEVDNLVRGTMNRMSLDLNGVLGPLPPKSGGTATSSGAAGSSSGSSGSSSGSTGSTGSTGDPAAATPSGADPAASTDPGTTPTDDTGTTPAEVGVAADVPFQGGLVGTPTQFTVFVSRVPDPLTNTATDESGQVRSDLVRISYWLGSNGRGLYRQERPWVTAEGIRNSTEPDLTNEAGDLLIEEVAEVSFEYFDGSGWVTEWDGGESVTVPGTTVTYIKGPPRAVRVTMILEIPIGNGQVISKTAVQVIPVRTAPGSATPQLINAASDSGTGSDTTGSGSDSSGTGGNMGGTGGNTGGGATGGGATGGGATGGGTRPGGAGGGATGGGNTGGGTRTSGSGGGATGGGATGGGNTGGGTRTGGGRP